MKETKVHTFTPVRLQFNGQSPVDRRLETKIERPNLSSLDEEIRLVNQLYPRYL